MIKKNKFKDYLHTISYNILGLIAGIFIFPVFLYYLNTNEIGEWYLYLTFYSILALFDFGLTSYLSRNITYCIAEATDNNIFCNKKLNSLLQNSFLLFFISSIIILLISFFFILPYLNYFILKKSQLFEFHTTWILYAIGIAFVNFSNFYNSILKGFNRIDNIQSTLSLVKIISLVFSFILLNFNLGIYAMIIAFLISSIFQLVFLKYHANKSIRFIFKIEFLNWHLVKFYISESISFFYMSVGTILIFQSISVLIATFLGLKILANYSFTVQIFTFLTVFTTMYLNLHIPELTFYHTCNNNDQIKTILKKSHVINIVLFSFGFIFLYLFSDLFFNLIGKNNLLLTGLQFYVITIIYFLEANMMLSTTFLIATNKIPFLKSSLISGFLITISAFFVLKYLGYGLTSLLFIQFLVQLSYNYWKWTSLVFDKYSIEVFNFINVKKVDQC